MKYSKKVSAKLKTIADMRKQHGVPATLETKKDGALDVVVLDPEVVLERFQRFPSLGFLIEFVEPGNQNMWDDFRKKGATPETLRAHLIWACLQNHKEGMTELDWPTIIKELSLPEALEYLKLKLDTY